MATAVGLCLLAYLAGSLPFAIWVTRWLKGIDVRAAGSGHATATNTIRQAGWPAGVLVFGLDAGKGFLTTYLAAQQSELAWIVPACAALVVVGHCWPMLAGFRGGMGLATAGGAMLALSPLAFLLGFGLLILLVLAVRHAARAAIATALVYPVAVWLSGLRGHIFWASVAISLVIAARFLGDWRREYRELWLDREKGAVEPGSWNAEE
jgi:glycerol-3-phosphate acyltransferase PlsY